MIEGRKGGKRGHFVGVQGVNVGLRESNQQRGLMLGIAQRDFKEDGFSGKRNSLKAPKQPSPQLACQEFHRGLTVAPHGDGFFLKESRDQK